MYRSLLVCFSSLNSLSSSKGTLGSQEIAMTKGLSSHLRTLTSRKLCIGSRYDPTLCLRLRTDAEFAEYMKTYYLPNASNETIEQLMEYYPSDPTKGSPFDTGYFNALTPQFKRLAAVQADAIFQAPRRFLLQNRFGKQNIWTYRTLSH